MSLWKFLAICLALVVLYYGGQNIKQRFTFTPVVANSPGQAVINSNTALVDGDKITFIATYRIENKAQEKILERLYDFHKVFVEYQQKISDEYGESFWKGGIDVYHRKLKYNKWLETATITIKGPKATVKPQGYDEIAIERTPKGHWLLSWPKDYRNVNKTRHILEAEIMLHKEAIKKVGKPGYSAKRIENELKEARKTRYEGSPQLAKMFNPQIQVITKDEERKEKALKEKQARKLTKRRESKPNIQIIPLSKQQ